MTILFVFLMVIVVPYTVFADCKIIDTTEKYEVVCSGLDSLSPASDSKKNTKKMKIVKKTKKVNFEDRENGKQTVAMNDEESQYMLTRNRQDGYSGKLKPREQTSKK